MTRSTTVRVAILAWIVLVIVISLQPARPSATAALHREFHWFAFAITAVLFRKLHAGPRPGLQSALAAVLLGAALEVLQTHLRYPFEWWDVRDDAIGAVAGILLYQAACFIWT
jgi:VanZ family protein